MQHFITVSLNKEVRNSMETKNKLKIILLLGLFISGSWWIRTHIIYSRGKQQTN